MDIFSALMQGFASAITVSNLLWCFVGCALGTAVGVLPGIGPAVAVAMLLPITAKVDITASMIFFSGIYYGAMYGGSTTSILLNTPGETASMVTAMEGNKMAKSGRAGAALATAAIGSFVAGTIATVNRHPVCALCGRVRGQAGVRPNTSCSCCWPSPLSARCWARAPCAA
jgi:putative tricarboxylic transport membrane protein